MTKRKRKEKKKRENLATKKKNAPLHLLPRHPAAPREHGAGHPHVCPPLRQRLDE